MPKDWVSHQIQGLLPLLWSGYKLVGSNFIKDSNMNNWYLKSTITGLLSGLLSMILFPNLLFGISVFVLVTVIMIFNNPKRRFMKAFWAVLSIFVGLNKFSLWVAGKIFDVSFIFDTSVLDWTVSIVLLLLAGLLLFLDYLERTDKKFNLFGLINISLTKEENVSHTHINNGANVTYITVHGDYIVGDGTRKNLNEFKEVKELLTREEELQLLINNPEIKNSEKLKTYQAELSEIRQKTKETKDEIISLSKTINLLVSKYPDEATKASQFLLSGFYGSAKDYFMHLQEERQDNKLAEKLGIEYDELLQLDHEVEEGHTSSDGMIYYYNIWFSGDSPQEIINKIDGVEKLGDRYCLEVSPWFFDEPEDDYDGHE